MYSSGNIDVRNWVHLFESPCVCVCLDDHRVSEGWCYEICIIIQPTPFPRYSASITSHERLWIEVSYYFNMGNPRYSATSASRHPPKTYVKVTSDTAPCWWGWCGLARQQAVPSHSSSRHCRSPFPLCSSPRSICSLTCYPFGQALAASPSLPLASTLLRFLKLSVRDSDLSITVHRGDDAVVTSPAD